MRPLLLLALPAAALGCVPDLGDPASLVTATRVLAVRGDPPEAAPGATVSYRALVASPVGTEAAPLLDWAFCRAPASLTDDGPVSPACLGDAVLPIMDTSPAASAATPPDACSLFGPDPPPGSFRPHDPDTTGGFYQPVRVTLGTLVAFYGERLPCPLPDAPTAAAVALAQGYEDNRNPTLLPLTASAGGTAISLDRIPAGGTVQLTTGWGAADAETYLMYDPATAAVVTRREALSVSWFATGGAFAAEVTGSAEDDPATATATTWTAPADPGVIHAWLVLRDSRGGVDFAAHDLTVLGPATP